MKSLLISLCLLPAIVFGIGISHPTTETNTFNGTTTFVRPSVQVTAVTANSFPITSNTTSSDTVFLATAHGLTTGNTIYILTNNGSSPSITGFHVVIVTDSDHFKFNPAFNCTGGTTTVFAKQNTTQFSATAHGFTAGALINLVGFNGPSGATDATGNWWINSHSPQTTVSATGLTANTFRIVEAIVTIAQNVGGTGGATAIGTTSAALRDAPALTLSTNGDIYGSIKGLIYGKVTNPDINDLSTGGVFESTDNSNPPSIRRAWFMSTQGNFDVGPAFRILDGEDLGKGNISLEIRGPNYYFNRLTTNGILQTTGGDGHITVSTTNPALIPATWANTAASTSIVSPVGRLGFQQDNTHLFYGTGGTGGWSDEFSFAGLSLGTSGSSTGSLTFFGVTSGFAEIRVADTGSNGTITFNAGTDTFSFTNGTSSLTVPAGVSGTLNASAFNGYSTALKSATTIVDVSAATAPSAGKVLTATDNTHATWQTPVGGGITVGTTPISGGTTTRLLYNNAGTVGEYPVVPGAQGGTGVANTGKTVTLGGNFSTTGAFNYTIALGATVIATAPSTDFSMARTDASQSLTGTQTLDTTNGPNVITFTKGGGGISLRSDIFRTTMQSCSTGQGYDFYITGDGAANTPIAFATNQRGVMWKMTQTGDLIPVPESGATENIGSSASPVPATYTTHIATGSQPTCTGATIGTGSKPNAGFVTATTTGASTVVVTFPITATTGWVILPSNNTTANMIRQIASSTTTATFTGTTVTGDVISYIAMPY